MKDLTAIFLTVNEMPECWEKFHRDVLLEALWDTPIITISRIPTDIGLNILQEEPKSPSNIYKQLLRWAKLATTDYIAVVEDDTLYNKEHFQLRPKMNEFWFNMTHWSLFAWWEPTYHWRNRRWNYSMIAPRLLLIEALEERFAQWPNGIPDNRVWELWKHMAERNMNVTLQKAVDMWTTIPIINLNHSSATDVLQINQRKRMWMLRCYDVPHWWKASELLKNYLWD